MVLEQFIVYCFIGFPIILLQMNVNEWNDNETLQYPMVE
jgi:hypothetical protein